MSVLEGNALRYAAGFVVHHVFKGVKKSSHELKRDITDCLMQLVLGKQDCEQGTAEEWTNLLDRGHVRETTFQVFYALEEREFDSSFQSCLHQQLPLVSKLSLWPSWSQMMMSNFIGQWPQLPLMLMTPKNMYIVDIFHGCF